MDYLDHTEARLKIGGLALCPAQKMPVRDLVRNRDRIKGVLQCEYLITVEALLDPSEKTIVDILTNSTEGFAMIEIIQRDGLR